MSSPLVGTYLGDGVYATCDGLMIRLTVEREGGLEAVYLEPNVYLALVAYADRLGWARPDLPTGPVQPYGPGAICDECGHFAERHQPAYCSGVPFGHEACACAGMLWLRVRWPRPYLPAPEGLTAG